MEGTKKKPVVVSLLFFSSVDQIFEYGKINFGEKKATSGYLLNAEYPYLPTKDKRYRRAILPAHFILYRITKDRIEVLNILHQAVSITQAKKNRNIKP